MNLRKGVQHMLKKIGEQTMYVQFNFGSFCYIGMSQYEGLSTAENLNLYSPDIEYFFDTESRTWKRLREELLK